ncbi:hypothetical protein QKT49_gp252 [Acanthamoeba castellanii medusavirus]|uniref:Uncharacterized protein n=1 Tax=Acanthamoeba castellanii medusavirus J1 TaxID=3114988 RepID=A0A3T1CXG4_9VIRU|nr:hypothetical protein QKT49_gp252 [Acanthamoeba castellanii medusavirus]BBI30511.1 hypothetical protein [Acanthamoeba castellanii medusavirus J1]
MASTLGSGSSTDKKTDTQLYTEYAIIALVILGLGGGAYWYYSKQQA